MWTTFNFWRLTLYVKFCRWRLKRASFLNFVLAGTIGPWRLGSWPQPIKFTFDFGTLYAPMLTGIKTFDLLGTFFPIGMCRCNSHRFFKKLMDYA